MASSEPLTPQPDTAQFWNRKYCLNVLFARRSITKWELTGIMCVGEVGQCCGSCRKSNLFSFCLNLSKKHQRYLNSSSKLASLQQTGLWLNFEFCQTVVFVRLFFLSSSENLKAVRKKNSWWWKPVSTVTYVAQGLHEKLRSSACCKVKSLRRHKWNVALGHHPEEQCQHAVSKELPKYEGAAKYKRLVRNSSWWRLVPEQKSQRTLGFSEEFTLTAGRVQIWSNSHFYDCDHFKMTVIWLTLILSNSSREISRNLPFFLTPPHVSLPCAVTWVWTPCERSQDCLRCHRDDTVMETETTRAENSFCWFDKYPLHWNANIWYLSSKM